MNVSIKTFFFPIQKARITPTCLHNDPVIRNIVHVIMAILPKPLPKIDDFAESGLSLDTFQKSRMDLGFLNVLQYHI